MTRFLAALLVATMAAGAAALAQTVQRLTLLSDDAGHVDWLRLPDGLIVFDRKGPDGYFQMWTMRGDGSGQTSLTAGRRELPGFHTGQPAWHPSGRWIVFQAQKAGIPKQFQKTSEPGAGMYNDLWIMTADATRFWKLVDLPVELNADARGILHPHFSADGTQLVWAERTGRGSKAFGSWVIRLADFVVAEAGPRLDNIRTLTPLLTGRGGAFYETHGFSPDGRALIYSSDVERGLKLYLHDLRSGSTRRLTEDPRVWDEHAIFSPDGRRIVHMSSRGLRFRVSPFDLQAEFWLMDGDGRNQHRLTYFHQPGHAHFRPGDFAVAADSAWRWDGKAFAGLVIRHRPETDQRGKGEIWLIELE